MCVSVSELVNKGYLKEDGISGIGINNVQVNRDKDSMVIIEELVEEIRYYCS